MATHIIIPSESSFYTDYNGSILFLAVGILAEIILYKSVYLVRILKAVGVRALDNDWFAEIGCSI